MEYNDIKTSMLKQHPTMRQSNLTDNFKSDFSFRIVIPTPTRHLMSPAHCPILCLFL